MSPLRRHGGGRPRTANSVLDLAERWGISEKSARRLAALNLSEEVLAIMAADCRHYAAGQHRRVARLKGTSMACALWGSAANHPPASFLARAAYE